MMALQAESLMRVTRLSAEDDGMHRADARAGEHGDGEFGDHLHVEADAVALLDAERLERVGGLLHLDLEFGVGEGLALLRVVALPYQRGVIAVAFVDMPIHAVVAGVEFAAAEPLNFSLAVIPLAHRVPFLAPAQSLGLFRPESLGVEHRAVVERLVFFERLDVRAGRELGRGRIHGNLLGL